MQHHLLSPDVVRKQYGILKQGSEFSLTALRFYFTLRFFVLCFLKVFTIRINCVILPLVLSYALPDTAFRATGTDKRIIPVALVLKRIGECTGFPHRAIQNAAREVQPLPVRGDYTNDPAARHRMLKETVKAFRVR